MTLPQFQLPQQAPNLDTPIEVSDEQREEATTAIAQLSEWLDNLPVILTQQQSVLCATIANEDNAQQMAELTSHVWEDGQNRLAREALHFDWLSLEGPARQTEYLLYSLHITGNITMSIGWRTTVSLTQLRAEAADAKDTLLSILQ